MKTPMYSRIWHQDNKWHLGIYIRRKLVVDRAFSTQEEATDAWNVYKDDNVKVRVSKPVQPVFVMKERSFG
jgi:hypothetical protein